MTKRGEKERKKREIKTSTNQQQEEKKRITCGRVETYKTRKGMEYRKKKQERKRSSLDSNEFHHVDTHINRTHDMTASLTCSILHIERIIHIYNSMGVDMWTNASFCGRLHACNLSLFFFQFFIFCFDGCVGWVVPFDPS